MTTNTKAFSGLAENYDKHRPSYPDALFTALAEYVKARRGEAWPSPAVLYDVGSGTGISTRQLRSHLGPDLAVRGIEPNEDMRRVAKGSTPPELQMEYLEGNAEHLPVAGGKASMLVAAQAAQWFDRPKFYDEAYRALHGRGVIAIFQNDRAWGGDPFLEEYETFLETWSEGYTRHYRDIDFIAELQERGFVEPSHQTFNWVRPMTPEQFAQMSLSSTKVQGAVRRLGQEEALRLLNALMASHVQADGNLHIPYVSALFMATRPVGEAERRGRP